MHASWVKESFLQWRTAWTRSLRSPEVGLSVCMHVIQESCGDAQQQIRPNLEACWMCGGQDVLSTARQAPALGAGVFSGGGCRPAPNLPLQGQLLCIHIRGTWGFLLC